MRKVSFATGERVAVIDQNKITYGVIKKMFPEVDPPIFMIEDENGDIRKVTIDKVAKIEAKDRSEESTEDQESKDLIEKSEITITADKFSEIASEIIAKETFKSGEKGIIIGLIVAHIISDIMVALFKNEDESDED